MDRDRQIQMSTRLFLLLGKGLYFLVRGIEDRYLYRADFNIREECTDNYSLQALHPSPYRMGYTDDDETV